MNKLHLTKEGRTKQNLNLKSNLKGTSTPTKESL